MKKTYSTDELMLRLYRSLWTDMQHACGISCNTKEMQKTWTLKGAREYKFLLHDNLSPYHYKWGAQMTSFLKRYVFEHDILTPKEREQKTNAKFIKLQEDLASNYGRKRSMRLHKVLCRARSICTRILSGFQPEGSSPKGRFGSKATVGCPASHAYLDEKLRNRPITGSLQQVEWAKNTLFECDPLLKTCLGENQFNYQVCSALPQVNVPKKNDIDRGINPNTLLGSFYSAALGAIVEEALRAEGLDIRRLQERHKIYARRASTTGKLVTADLSDASHGFLSHIINALMPRKWFRALMYGVIRQVEVDGRVYRLESIMTMGIGFTFPVQTLLFYCLLKALSELTNISGLISVYGDDLIYPRKLHPFVVSIFKELGFKLNLDKTFVESRFRESCGGDYFKGVDVRPYSPEGIGTRMGRVEYAAFCYKLLNGLQRKWDVCEIRRCTFLLKFEICMVMGRLFVVPDHFPDHSGWKNCHSEYKQALHAKPLWVFPLADWRWDVETQKYNFPHIQFTPDRHYVRSLSPYYWDKLRSYALREPDQVVSILSLPHYIGTPTFKWKRDKREGRKVVKRGLRATVASKDAQAGRYRLYYPAKE